VPCHANVYTSQAVLFPLCEAKIARGINAELVAYPFVRSNVLMIVHLAERRVSGQSAYALNTS